MAKKAAEKTKKVVDEKATKKMPEKKNSKAVKPGLSLKKSPVTLPPQKIEKPKPLSAKEKADFRARLVRLRDELMGQVSSLKDESLMREDNIDSAEDGSDAFDRQFALNLASAEQDSIFEIDEALRRLELGTFGACETCTGAIGPVRLQALPFVRTCVGCQSELEKTKPKFRAG